MKLFRMRGTARRLVLVASVAALLATSCTQLVQDEAIISSDQLQGRANATEGSARAQSYLIDRLKTFSVPLRPTPPGPPPAAAFKQTFDAGTNILSKIPGTDGGSQFVIVGAHYDHLGTTCRTSNPDDHICNGATDNGAGVAALLSVGELIAKASPSRTVILALWDREEDGLLGSKYYTQHPVVPLAQTVAYVNFDIQGANLLPSLQNSSFAIGAESGGAAMTALVKNAIGTGPLRTKLVSSIFGQGRSDYVSFTAVGVPNVFFSDSTGPCYHSAQDEVGIVDFWKLDQQVKIAYKLTMSLAKAGPHPTFSATNPLATFADALSLQSVVNASLVDLPRFTATQQTQLLKFRADINTIVSAGAANFGADDISVLVAGAAGAVSILTTGPCDGFISRQ
jgi:hypothetical protein